MKEFGETCVYTCRKQVRVVALIIGLISICTMIILGVTDASPLTLASSFVLLMLANAFIVFPWRRSSGACLCSRTAVPDCMRTAASRDEPRGWQKVSTSVMVLSSSNRVFLYTDLIWPLHEWACDTSRLSGLS